MRRNPEPVAYATDLEKDLRGRVRGEVRFDAGSRALYATDASNYRQVPIGVVIPKDADDVVETVAAARRFGAPILARGGGTSLAGQCCNVALVLDMSKYMHNVLELDPQKSQAVIQPGLVLDDLRHAAQKHGLTFAADPATHNHCTLGGMIGNNSCGVHSLMSGRTLDNVEELEILTYDGVRMRVGKTTDSELDDIIHDGGRRGEIYAGLRRIRDKYADLIRTRYPKIPRRVSGYSLDQLLPENDFHVARSLVGTESTCVLVLEAKLRLVHWPPVRSLLVLGYEDIFTAADHIPEILPYQPIGLEGIDETLVDDMKKKKLHPENLRLLPEGRGWLLVEFGGESEEDADSKAERLMHDLRSMRVVPSMKLYDDPKQEDLVWKIRESGLGSTARVPGEEETWEGWEDSAVPPDRIGDYLRDFRKLLDRYRFRGALYGHLGQGCLHTRINFDLVTANGVQTYRAFIEDAADIVLRYGGSFSGEHGDGQSRAELLPKMFGPELIQAFREFKALWDPQWKMNPGKIVAPYRIDENLRLGPEYDHPEPRTDFTYPDDKHSFSFAMRRCVGVGECRKEEHGTMCPSYMVTREEMHSTRGRAHLLFEMLEGNPLTGGWKDEHVREALDLCFACKACKSECPVNVDMAAYKAEFLSHYYEHALRPPSAYTMGWIYWWARAASTAPRLANWAAQTFPFSSIARRMSGMSSERTVPKFAAKTFTSVRRGGPTRRGNVILWPDTFNNHFHPDVLHAAFNSLRRLGYDVQVPQHSLCCGRPLYDFGFLSTAKNLLIQILETLREDIRSGKPVIVLEPSCASVFRDEMMNLLPENSDAKRLSQQTFLLSEFLQKHAAEAIFPHLPHAALIHGHCHHKAIFGMDDEEKVLQRLGLDYEILDSGCCGMAGAFGFEKDHYDVSLKAGERILLPRVREASTDTLIVTDGFSCREQIAQTTNRRARHLAEVVDMAFKVGTKDHRVGPPRPLRAA
jgi:FAD/FMN-containing dehydrogenase/Fe-S oxidoreductase